jgi:hypothetical protein
MIPDPYRDIVVRLHKRTQQGEVIWNSLSATAYSISIGTYSLAIQIRDNRPFQSAGEYAFVLYNSTGMMIDSFEIDDDDEDYGLVEELFLVVRRRALGVDKAITALSKALDSDGVVGIELSKPEDDVDIPF